MQFLLKKRGATMCIQILYRNTSMYSLLPPMTLAPSTVCALWMLLPEQNYIKNKVVSIIPAGIKDNLASIYH